ncbi:hypothetical protein BKA67DRAFT_678846 [Truncatella angustata]|uniref:Uncharacterized protein n=1 Tax=Truncatella angustata TaxID=152316 RepID=A0A9P8ZXV3_9PEZI|nr:uncharacterized protein BKA67DRAFT_678846 [Truncatella angustata]KAH6653403.1 hypothetical protein BKA67DRAFT_678846 [Truncatella angustata]
MRQAMLRTFSLLTILLIVNYGESIYLIYYGCSTEGRSTRQKISIQSFIEGWKMFIYRPTIQKKAVPCFKKVCGWRSKEVRGENSSQLNIKSWLAGAYLDDRRIKKAIAIYKRVVAVRRETLDEKDHSRLGSEHALASAYLKDGLAQEAIDLLKHVVSVESQLYAEDDPDRQISIDLLGDARAQLEAEWETSEDDSEVSGCSQDLVPDRVIASLYREKGVSCRAGGRCCPDPHTDLGFHTIPPSLGLVQRPAPARFRSVHHLLALIEVSVPVARPYVQSPCLETAAGSPEYDRFEILTGRPGKQSRIGRFRRLSLVRHWPHAIPPSWSRGRHPGLLYTPPHHTMALGG